LLDCHLREGSGLQLSLSQLHTRQRPACRSFGIFRVSCRYIQDIVQFVGFLGLWREAAPPRDGREILLLPFPCLCSGQHVQNSVFGALRRMVCCPSHFLLQGCTLPGQVRAGAAWQEPALQTRIRSTSGGMQPRARASSPPTSRRGLAWVGCFYLQLTR